MRISHERATHIAHIITDGIWKDDLVDYTDDSKALQAVKDAIFEFLSDDEAADAAARRKITSQSKPIHEGSQEWEILYRKYYEEELHLKGW